MAADSEEVISDYAKSSTQKIRITEYFNQWRLAIGGAGDGTYIDLFEELLARRLAVFKEYEHDKIESVIRATLHEVHKKHIWPRHGDQRTSFQAIIGIQGCGERKGRSLLYTQDSALLRVTGTVGFKTIGVGCYLADYIIKRAIPDYGGIYNMPTEQVGNLAVHVLAEVKSPDCGIKDVDGQTNVLILDGIYGGTRWLIDHEVKRVEQWLESYNSIQRPLMMAIANPRLPQDKFEEVLNLCSAQIFSLRLAETQTIAEWDRQAREWEEQIRRSGQSVTQTSDD